MHKKITLAVTAFALAMGAYLFLSRGDRTSRVEQVNISTDALDRFVTRPRGGTETISNERVKLSPGEKSVSRVFDDITGELKYRFEVEGWEPTEVDAEVHVSKPVIQIFMPRGEITTISSDEADLTLASTATNRPEPKRGVLTGNVKVVIDRATRQWREANPESVDAQDHPEQMITIRMETARFDLDRAELVSTELVTVDSREGTLEGVRGLTVHWDQVDNRIQLLRFEHGGRMVLKRGADAVSFTLPGSERRKKRRPRSASGDGLAVPAVVVARTPRARANQPLSIDSITAEEAAAEIRFEDSVVEANQSVSIYDDGFKGNKPAAPGPGRRTAESLAAEMKSMKDEMQEGLEQKPPASNDQIDDLYPEQRPKKKLHTYQAIFDHEVVVEQYAGTKQTGKMTAEKLEVHFDFGSRQRRMVGVGPQVKANQPTSDPEKAEEQPSAEPAPRDPEFEDDGSRLVLKWNGPLEIRPIRVDPSKQTGKRFDVIASGAPLRVTSEQGNANCRQLVYRNEQKQIWLSNQSEKTVELSVSDSRRLVGEEIFFDQKRGLARVDGPGFMMDLRKPEGPRAGMTAASNSPEAKQRDPVEIRWTKGVDLEIGSRTVQRMDPETGLMQDKEKEFLRRAWFHGEVFFQQGEETLQADEVAATFGPPDTADAVADYIEHLNMTGSVKMKRQDDLIQAERLDVELIKTVDGRNIPRIVDAAGKVVAKQGQREIYADSIHSILGQYPGKMKLAADGKTPIRGKPVLGLDALDATGNILVKDPEQNLKVSRAETMNARLRNGNELVRVTIVSPKSEIFARARFNDLAVHGHRIEIDVDANTVDVPGAGRAWMVSRQDFGGRRAKKPTIVKTVWTDNMQLRLAKNCGVFLGDVRSTSEDFALRCDKLTIRFAKVPPVRNVPDEDFIDRFGIIGSIIKGNAELDKSERMTISAERKRPTHIIAEGSAQALSSTHAPGQDKTVQGRLLSRVGITGAQIIVDLAREQMRVPCEGTLLIEDYQIKGQTRPADRLRSSKISGPMMSSMRSDGPSQTLLSWANSMDFFVDRALLSLDKDVAMVHRSGQKMVLKGQIAEAMNLDMRDLKHLSSGRTAKLTCGHLLLEFMTGQRSGEQSQIVQATDLKRLIARDTVHFQEGSKSLMGAYLQFLQDTNEVRLEGNSALEARIIDQDEASGRLRMWRSPQLIWNRLTNQVEAPDAQVRTAGG